MTSLFIFLPDGNMLQRESAELAFKLTRAINEGYWEDYLPYPASQKAAWRAIQLDQRVIVYSPPQSAIPDLPAFKPRELQILQLLASGYTLRQIAWVLHIQLRTVSAQLNRLRAKLRARSSFELVALAVKYGLIQPEDPD